MRALLLFLPAMIAAAPATQSAAPPADVAPGQTHDVNFATDDFGRMTVAVRVGDRGPYRFLIDTGAERTVISRQLAEVLGLAAGSGMKVQSVLGLAPVQTVRIPVLQVSNRSVAVANAPAFESADIGADGVLGVDSLARQRVTLDFKRGVMGVSPSADSREDVDEETIVVVARRRHGRLLFANAAVDNRGVVVVVDTGSEISVGNEALRAKLLRGRQVLPKAELITIAGESAMADIMTAQLVEIDGLKIRKVEIAFLRAPVFNQLGLENRPALLLGMNVMRAFDRVSIDFATGKVRFVLPRTSMARVTRLAAR